MNAFVNGAYHRFIVLAIEPVDVGIGRSDQTTSNVAQPLVVDVAVPGNDLIRSLGQSAQTSTGGVVIWPADGARDVSKLMGNESPDPVPEADVLFLGTPVSVNVGSARTIFVTSFSITNSATGAIVPTHLLTHFNDPNGLVPISYAAAIPLNALDSNESYTVDFQGGILEPDTNASTALSRTWTFSTGSA